MLKIINYIIVTFISIFLYSCDNLLDIDAYNKLKYGTDTVTDNGGESSSIPWTVEDNWVNFYTADSSLEDTSFLYVVDDTSSTTFNECEINLVAVRSTGGIVFCYQNSNNYYRFSVTPSGGGYSLYTVINGIETRKSFGSSGWIEQSGTNNLKVVQTNSGVFHIYVNGDDHTVLNDSTFKGGKTGYYVKVSSYVTNEYDSSCKFQMITPVINP